MIKNHAFTKLFALILICSFSFLSCEKQESTEIDLNQEYKVWYELNHNFEMNKNPVFLGKLDWENSFQFHNNKLIPLVIEKGATRLKQNFKNSNNQIQAKPFLVITKTDNGYTEALRVFLSSNDEGFKNKTQLLKLSYIEYSYKIISGKTIEISMFYRKKDLKIHQNIVNNGNVSTDILETASKGCVETHVFQTDHYSDGTSESHYLYSFTSCTAGGGSNGDSGGGGSNGGNNGGGNGDGTPNPVLGEGGQIYPNVSCKSFDFNIANDNTTLVAAVKDMIVSVEAWADASGTQGSYTGRIKFDELYFTMPYATGDLAEGMAADAMKEASKITAAWIKYYNPPYLGTATVIQELYKNMQKQMGLIGGSVNAVSGYSNQVTPKPAQYSHVGTGSCPRPR